MNLRELGYLRSALISLRQLSCFDDDALFLIEVADLREKIKGPSRIVMEHALYRSGIDEFKIRRI